MARQKFMLTGDIIGSTRTVTRQSRRVKRQQPADSLKPRLSARSAVSARQVRCSTSVAGGAAITIHGLLAASLATTVVDAGSVDPAVAKEVFQRLTKIAEVAARQKQRLVGALAADMRNQRELADVLGLSQAQISRILTAHHSKPEASPTEIIDQRDAGVIDDAQMLTRLIGLEYSYDRFPNAGSIESAAYVPGTCNEVEEAFTAGRITRDQYIAVMDAHRDEIVAAAEHS